MRWPARIGRWEIRGSIGSGGTAEVLLGVAARPDGGEDEAAIKRPLAERTEDPAAIDLVYAEANILSRVRHPNVVGFLELVEGPPPALVLERLRGHTLAELAPLEGDAAIALAIEIGVQAATALAAVHAVTDADGVPLRAVHRDVAPDNLFVTEDGTLKLFDFNVASFHGRSQAPAPGAMQGRIAYMAPEQARSEPVDGTADVFSLGVVLWERVVGDRLLWRGNTLATLRAVVDEPIPLASARVPVPAPLDALLVEMLARDRTQRPSAALVAARLEAMRSDRDTARASLGALACGTTMVG